METLLLTMSLIQKQIYCQIQNLKLSLTIKMTLVLMDGKTKIKFASMTIIALGTKINIVLT